MLGVVAMLGAIKGFAWYFDTAAGAATVDAPQHQANDFVSPINTVWVLVTAFLVFFMQAGFMGLEAGFARSRETVNILMECVFDTCLCGILYWAIGFAFQFGAGNGLIGHQFFFLHGMTAGYGGDRASRSWRSSSSSSPSPTRRRRSRRAPWSAAPSFKGDILYSICVSGFIYPIFGHWVWGPGGWLSNTMGWFHSSDRRHRLP